MSAIKIVKNYGTKIRNVRSWHTTERLMRLDVGVEVEAIGVLPILRDNPKRFVG